MAKFSKTSIQRLSGCHADLIALMNASIIDYDFAVICGFRNQKDQNAAYNAGTSKLVYPNSKHNLQPSHAVDIAPVKYAADGDVWIDWKDIQSFIDLSKVVFKHAKAMNIDIRWGGDFRRDGDTTRNDAWDKPHYEIVL